MNKYAHMAAALAALVLATAPPLARAEGDHAGMRHAAAGNVGSAQGEIRRIDPDAGRLTLRHGDIANLDMPGMTMAFAVDDKRLLEGLKVGQQVAFKVEERGGDLVVVEVAPLP